MIQNSLSFHCQVYTGCQPGKKWLDSHLFLLLPSQLALLPLWYNSLKSVTYCLSKFTHPDKLTVKQRSVFLLDKSYLQAYLRERHRQFFLSKWRLTPAYSSLFFQMIKENYGRYDWFINWESFLLLTKCPALNPARWVAFEILILGC